MGDVLKAAPRDTAADIAAEALFEAIIDGRIAPGAPLRLQEVADQLGMSMMPVREAIRQLAALDLVEIVPHKGATVRPVSLSDLEETYFTRIHLEALAVREAALRFTSEDAALARAALDERVTALGREDHVGLRNAHERFHFVLYEAARRPWLTRSILPAWRNSERYRVEAMRHPEQVRKRSEEHAALLAAVESGDVDGAVRTLVAHLRSSVELSARAMRDESDDTPLPVPSAEDLLPPVTSS